MVNYYMGYYLLIFNQTALEGCMGAEKNKPLRDLRLVFLFYSVLTNAKASNKYIGLCGIR